MTENQFDIFIDRSKSSSAKWEMTHKYGEDIIPMSVADMDLSAPRKMIEYLSRQNNVGIYGYTILPDNYYDIVRKYIFRHYNYKTTNDSILFCPRIIQAISIYIKEFTSKNDRICILTPSYSPIIDAITLNERYAEKCELVYHKGNYSIDFHKLEKCFKISKAFILISPHNPTGIVWSYNELQKISQLAEKYRVFILSDDVHADFDFSDNKHIIISTLSKYIENNSIICTSPAKTFNIPGLEISNLIIYNNNVRTKFQKCMQALGMHNPNFFSIPAINIAYQYCDEWLESLKHYIYQNKILVREFFNQNIPQLEIANSEGTYLVWINYSKLHINEEKLKHWFIDLSHIEVSWGSNFGVKDLPFFRMNIAMPRSLLEECLDKIKNGLTLLIQEEINYEYAQ
ncbi:MalY/PatB family protein [Necropsobacter massiliensis]|uniref:MalY/PatB family protein n=1 Tax=Necropsobacter massiliensis TaxID=1400001 RepID=UPI0005962426|nr:MalY/PatB family protein [Necropsobacter massiliensis]